MSEALIKKYANKTPEQMEREQADIEEEYIVASKELDQKLLNASSKVDFMEFGDAIIHVKRPTREQIDRMTPPELAKYRKNPTEVPYEIAKEYEETMYKLMEELIIFPKHTAIEWKQLTGDEFMAAFQTHLMTIQSKIQKDAERFLQQI